MLKTQHETRKLCHVMLFACCYFTLSHLDGSSRWFSFIKILQEKKNTAGRASEKTQSVKCELPEPGDMCFISRTHRKVERRELTSQSCS